MIRLLRSLLIGALALSASASTIPTVGVGGGANNTTCSEATTFLARTSGLTAKYTLSYTEFICALVANSLWSKFDLLYILATKDATTASLNLVGTSYTLTPVGTPTFTADTGYNGFSALNFLSTSFAPSTNGVQFTQNSAHMLIWQMTSPTTGLTDGSTGLGLDNASLISSVPPNLGGGANDTFNADNYPSSSTGIGSASWSRTGASAVSVYQNGRPIITTTTASQALNAFMFYIGCTNFAGTSAFCSDGNLAVFTAGASFTDAQMLTFHNLLKQFLHGIGAN